jgi:aspartate aminotransferase/aminotransferase
MIENWIADRVRAIDVGSIRKVMQLAANLKDPVNLSIGQPHFPIPEAIKTAACQAIQQNRNGYTLAQGIPELQGKIQAEVRRRFPDQPQRDALVTNGTSGGLVLALTCIINPGDEVIVFDPYFVMYPNFIGLVGGKTVCVDTYPDFLIDVDKVKAAITPRTKAIIVNSPANPTGVVYGKDCLRDLALLAQQRKILLISDEVYSSYCYDGPFASPAQFSEDVVAIDGFSKTYGMTGWRLGWCHGPRRLIDEMIKIQQFTFVCAPSMVHHAGDTALDQDVTAIFADFKHKRDRLLEALGGGYEINGAEGSFYLFPRVPWGTGTEFVAEAIRNNLLLLPGNVFSRQDTHFRLSYSVSDEVLERGIAILQKMRDKR